MGENDHDNVPPKGEKVGCMALLAIISILFFVWFFNPMGLGDTLVALPHRAASHLILRLVESGATLCGPGQTAGFSSEGLYMGCVSTLR